MTLSAISIHPIKSCRRVNLDQASVGVTGLAGDRQWQIVDDDGKPITQRSERALVAIAPQLIEGGIRVMAPGHDEIEVASPTTADLEVFGLLGDELVAGDAGDEVAVWFSSVIGVSCRLAAMVAGHERGVMDLSQPISFVDAGPVLVTSEASLADLVRRASEPFLMDRFRPNLVVAGAEPWAEDTWSSFRVGSARLEQVLPCPRCTMPQIDQDTAQRHREPAVALRAHRWCDDASAAEKHYRPALEGNALFGTYCTIHDAGTLVAVGDSVVIDAHQRPIIAPPS